MKRLGFGLAALAVSLTASCETAGELLVSGVMSGDWKGEAFCAPGMKVGMTLTMAYLPGGAVAANNEVSIKGDNGVLSLGAYSLTGTYDPQTYKLSLKPDGVWTKEPPTPGRKPIPPPIETSLDPNSRTMSVLQSDACEAFVLSHG